MKSIITPVMLFMALGLQAQVNSSAVNRAADSPSVETLAKELAEIAVENNGTAVQEALTKASEFNYKAQKTSWLDNFRASGNLNGFSNRTDINGIPANAFYPRYNIGVSVPFGIFVNHPKQTKAQFYRYQAEQESLKMAKQELRLQVITAYHDFVRTQRLYQLQEEVLQDAEFATKKTEEKFGKGEVTLEAYTAATKRYNSEQVAKISLERDLAVGKAQLEILLNMPLDAAVAKARRVRRTPSGQKR